VYSIGSISSPHTSHLNLGGTDKSPASTTSKVSTTSLGISSLTLQLGQRNVICLFFSASLSACLLFLFAFFFYLSSFSFLP